MPTACASGRGGAERRRPDELTVELDGEISESGMRGNLLPARNGDIARPSGGKGSVKGHVNKRGKT